MQIVTLTTDFGLQDYYTAVLKGSILCQNPALNIVDISHNIKSFDIVQAAYIFKNAWNNFPQGTIHVICIGESFSPKQSYILFNYQGHFFIGPDNGIFSMVFEEQPVEIIELPNTGSYSEVIYSNAVGHISKGKSLSELGQSIDTYVKRISLQAVISTSQIRGSVIHIDNYENVILNISKALFDQVGEGRPFSLFFKRHDPITILSEDYQDVAVGDVLCLFNSTSYLEIAINMGKASSLLGLKADDTIQIDFHY